MTTVYADTVAALTAAHSPGDVILLKRGTTYAGPLTFGSSGTADAHIRIGAYGTGAAPIITGNATLYSDALIIAGNYVDVGDLLLSDTNRAGIQIAATASHVTIANCEMTRVGEGVGILGSYVLVTGCNIHDLTMVKNTVTPANDDYGANGFVIAGSHVEIAFNTIKNAKAASCDYGVDGGAFELYASGAMSDISIHDNWVQDSKGFLEGGGAYGTNAAISNVSVYNNVSINNGGFATIHNTVGGSFGATWANVEFFGNTIVEENNVAHVGSSVYLDNATSIAGLSFHHNVFSLNDGDSVWKQYATGYHHDNIFRLQAAGTHLYNGWQMTLSPGELLADPLFIDQAGRNLMLQAGTPSPGMGAK